MAKKHEAPGAMVQKWWARLSPLPGGKILFSMIIGQTAPYTGSIRARAEELRPGFARWSLRDHRAIRNHLDSIHAVALTNLAEVTTGTAMLMSLPAGTRGIVTALTTTYIKKARGRLVAECRCELPEIVGDTRFELSCEIHDASGAVVATATVTWLLSRIHPSSRAPRDGHPERSEGSAHSSG
jgi:acyl-coenzyme A thioesterase PaaI-like protein